MPGRLSRRTSWFKPRSSSLHFSAFPIIRSKSAFDIRKDLPDWTVCKSNISTQLVKCVDECRNQAVQVKRQLSKCISECKTQASQYKNSSARRESKRKSTRRPPQTSDHNAVGRMASSDNDNDYNDWGSEFEESEDDDEISNHEQEAAATRGEFERNDQQHQFNQRGHHNKQSWNVQEHKQDYNHQEIATSSMDSGVVLTNVKPFQGDNSSQIGLPRPPSSLLKKPLVLSKPGIPKPPTAKLQDIRSSSMSRPTMHPPAPPGPPSPESEYEIPIDIGLKSSYNGGGGLFQSHHPNIDARPFIKTPSTVQRFSYTDTVQSSPIIDTSYETIRPPEDDYEPFNEPPPIAPFRPAVALPFNPRGAEFAPSSNNPNQGIISQHQELKNRPPNNIAQPYRNHDPRPTVAVNKHQKNDNLRSMEAIRLLQERVAKANITSSQQRNSGENESNSSNIPPPPSPPVIPYKGGGVRPPLPSLPNAPTPVAPRRPQVPIPLNMEKRLPIVPPKLPQTVKPFSGPEPKSRLLPPVPDDTDSQASSQAQDNSTQPLDKQPYFHQVERLEAQKMVLAMEKDGVFLVRPSRKGGDDAPYALTIVESGKAIHLNIRKKEAEYALGKEKDNEKTFKSVQAMIKHHLSNPIYITSQGWVAKECILKEYPYNSKANPNEYQKS